MSPAKLDPKLQPSKHAQKNIYITWRRVSRLSLPDGRKVPCKSKEPNIAAESFDDLRYVIYTTRKTTFSELLLHPQQLKDRYYELTTL